METIGTSFSKVIQNKILEEFGIKCNCRIFKDFLFKDDFAISIIFYHNGKVLEYRKLYKFNVSDEDIVEDFKKAIRIENKKGELNEKIQSFSQGIDERR